MRNTNWTLIALALVAAVAIFYFMKKSDFMKAPEAVNVPAEMAKSMDDDAAQVMTEEDATIDDEMMNDASDEDDSMMVMSDDETD